jgi:hypothetical protein
MPDMLVKLYELPPLEPVLADQATKGITIRRAIAPEKHLVLEWVLQHFSAYWHSECDAAFAHHPIGCFLAVKEAALVGFGCYDATIKGFFGPTGVNSTERGLGIGKALLLACLHSMKWEGYGYAIIGGVGPADFYAKTVGATVIEGSTPGIYTGMLRKAKPHPQV